MVITFGLGTYQEQVEDKHMQQYIYCTYIGIVVGVCINYKRWCLVWSPLEMTDDMF